MHAMAVSHSMLSKQPMQFASDVLLTALAEAGVQEVYMQYLGAKQSLPSAVQLINKLQSYRGMQAWPPIALDIARTFPSRLANGTSIDALQLDIVMDAADGDPCASEASSDSDSPLGGGTQIVSAAAETVAHSSVVQDPLAFRPDVPRVRGSFASGAAVFALHPYLGVLGNLPSGGCRITLKVRFH